MLEVLPGGTGVVGGCHSGHLAIKGTVICEEFLFAYCVPSLFATVVGFFIVSSCEELLALEPFELWSANGEDSAKGNDYRRKSDGFPSNG